MRQVARKNRVLVTMIGQGFHGTVTPPAILRNIFENPAWYTAYTPYQPEISQGRLEALLNFQTMVCDLTGLDIANASLLDEATAAAEAMAMAQRVAKSKANGLLRRRGLPSAEHRGDEDPGRAPGDRDRRRPGRGAGRRGGVRRDLPVSRAPMACCATTATQMEALHAAGAVGIVIADPLALCLLKEPGAMGADIAVGSTQRFGVPMGCGGPSAAYMACHDALKRSMPGRIVGVSVDARGNRAYRLSLQTREQHIRREKATSNICTAQALLAVMASMYAVFHGPVGLRAIAERVHRQTARLARGLEAGGYRIEPGEFFDTITVEVGAVQGAILESGAARGDQLPQAGPRPGSG